MEKKELEKAKEIFIKYNGNKYFMAINGDYEYYQSFDILRETEYKWIGEYLEEILNQIEKEEYKHENIDEIIINTFNIYRNYEIVLNTIPNMLDIFSEKLLSDIDTFSKLIIAEEILDLLDSLGDNTNVNRIKDLREFSKEILEDILANPVEIKDYHKKLDYLSKELSEDNIKKRAQSRLENGIK